ncbi:hypothetical protein RDWZM_009149 [Blomia tropicalis]|uniref:Rap-GAP domain-containing protein n=1 Tax=Blomia tropicalis TaxID=40697 RepID=A0A9Q0M4V9_BLOTA|nr:hypothetical protein RDWZM_009149 [Blomia tropicalis]
MSVRVDAVDGYDHVDDGGGRGGSVRIGRANGGGGRRRRRRDITGSFGSPGEDFICKLRDFKRQSLGCAEARRKSSTTLSFAVPVQACPGAGYCLKYPHDVKPTPGYWIECRGGASPINITEMSNRDQTCNPYGECGEIGEDSEMKTHLITSELSINRSGGGIKPPPTPTVEAVLTRGRLTRQETIKSNREEQFIGGDDGFDHNAEEKPISKDDLDLVRKPSMASQQPFPNITITIVQPSSPPSSPPIGSKGAQTSGGGGAASSGTQWNSTQGKQHQQHQSPVISSGRRASISSLCHTGPNVECNKTSNNNNNKASGVPVIEVEDTSLINRGDDPFELISFEEEIFEKYFYGREHWNYFTNDEALGPVIMSLKQETISGRDQFRLLLRTISYSLHGLVPTSAICADRYDREAVVRALGDEAGLKPSLVLGQLPSTPDELLKLDQVFVKSELKVGVIYVQGNQVNSEEAILGNRQESSLFKEFLSILGDRIRLKGFDKYKGGLDTVHDLTGTESVYTCYKNIEIMFHVSTMLPHEECDAQKLQKKRHIGNDIVCVAFLEGDDSLFWPGCIKSHFLHTFIVVKTSPKPLDGDEIRKYKVAVVCRDEVTAFKPFLWHQSEFEKDAYFREWLLTKIINGERASYSAPKFARMQDRTRSQMLEDIVNNLANHLATGQIPKPYRRGSWRPIGHMRPSSPLLDSVRDLFEGYDQLAKDFNNAFHGNAKLLCDVVFNVIGSPNGQPIQNAVNNSCEHGGVRRIYAVRAILAIRSRVFLEMLYGFAPPRGQGGQIQTTSSEAASTLTSNTISSGGGGGGTGGGSSGGKDSRRSSSGRSSAASSKRGSITAETMNKIAQLPKIIAPSMDRKDRNKDKDSDKDSRKASTVSTISANAYSSASNSSTVSAKTPTYLTVPGTSSGGNVIKNAFNRLVSGSWSGWGTKGRNESMKRWQSESFYAKMDNVGVEVPGLSVCADIAKIDRNKLAQTEFTIIEFDGDTFQLLIEYMHSGSCPLSCDTVPGLICAAEHFDLPDLLQACVHHTKTHLRLAVVPRMLTALENYVWRYTSASQLQFTIMTYIDPRASRLFDRIEYLMLSESVLQQILTRKQLMMSETQKFKTMLQWALYKVTKGQFIGYERPDNLSSVASIELGLIMRRLTRDLKLNLIPPHDLIKIVLPSKTMNNDQILNTLFFHQTKTQSNQQQQQQQQ